MMIDVGDSCFSKNPRFESDEISSICLKFSHKEATFNTTWTIWTSHLSAPVSPECYIPRALPVEIRDLSWSPKRWMNLRGIPGTWIPLGNRLGSVRAREFFEPQMIFCSVSCMGWRIGHLDDEIECFLVFCAYFLKGFHRNGPRNVLKVS